MKSKLYIFIFFFSIGIISVYYINSKNITSIEEHDLQTISIDYNDFFKKSKIADSVKITIFESKELISEISKLIIADSDIYIVDFDYDNLFKVDKKNNILNKLSSIGTTKGHYIEITDLNFYDDYIYLLCNQRHKLLKFNKEGEFLKESNTPPYISSFALSGGRYYYYHYLSTSSDNLYRISSSKNNFEKYYLKYDKELEIQYSDIGSVENTGDEILVTIPRSNTIYGVTSNCISAKYRFNFIKNPLTKERSLLSPIEYANSDRITSNFIYGNTTSLFLKFLYF